MNADSANKCPTFHDTTAICQWSHMGGVATSENTAQIYWKAGVVNS